MNAADIRNKRIVTRGRDVVTLDTGQEFITYYAKAHGNDRLVSVVVSCRCVCAELLTAYRYWVYGWDWGNLAVIIGEHFDRIECTSRASGVDVKGWHCIFQQMPHICTFRTVEVRI